MNDVVFTKSLFEFIGTAILVLFGDGGGCLESFEEVERRERRLGCRDNSLGTCRHARCLHLGALFGRPSQPCCYAGSGCCRNIQLEFGCSLHSGADARRFYGAVLVYLYYKDHYDATDDPAAKLATFCTAPAIRNYGRNLFSEIVGTFMLVFVILALSIDGNTSEVGMGALGAFPVAMLIIALGMSLGGTTGYAINRLGIWLRASLTPFLPIKGKGTNDWGYSWVPVAGPIIGGFIAAALYCLIYC